MEAPRPPYAYLLKGRGMYKIVIVDDEALVRRGVVLETDWNSIGAAVVGEAENGEEGLKLIEKLKPDLVISDIRMPGMDGLDMLKALRIEGNEVPVILLTAYSDFSYAQRAVKYGAMDYLLKPYTDGELEEAVKKLIEKFDSKKESAEKQHSDDILPEEAYRESGKSKYINEALYYIAEHFSDQDIVVKKIADHIGLSEGHLSHTFKKETDYTVNAYITRFRIRAAMRLLKDCRHKVYEVAETVGYKDLTYFSSTFKKLVGLSPSEYQDRS